MRYALMWIGKCYQENEMFLKGMFNVIQATLVKAGAHQREPANPESNILMTAPMPPKQTS